MLTNKQCHVGINVIAAFAGAVVVAACEQRGEGSAGDTRIAIVNGSPVTDPEDLGHVWIEWKDGGFTGTESRGSGTLVRSDWVLTAAHVLNQSNCPETLNVTGNTIYTCTFVPESHWVYLGNQAPLQPAQQAKKVFVHPLYTPGATTTNVDIAVIRTASSFAPGEGAGYIKTLYGGTASSLTQSPQPNLILFGYGCTDADQQVCKTSTASAIAYSANFKALQMYVDGNYRVEPQGSWKSQVGDSGGPYMLAGEIAAVHFARDLQNPTWGHAVPAARFRSWLELAIDPNTIDSANADFNLDLTPEAYFLRRGYSSPLGGTWYAVTILSGPNEYTFNLFPDTGSPLASSAFALGDFDGNSWPDMVGQVNGQTFYLSPTAPLTFAPKTLSLASGTKESFAVGDFDDNGVKDLEIRDFTSGYADVYYGCDGTGGCGTPGLLPGSLYNGIPSALGVDGKYLTVSGVGLGTITFPSVQLAVDVPATQASFDIQIFDGDFGSTNDQNGGGKTCYRLFADGDSDLSPPIDPGTGLFKYIINVDDTFFADHEWQSLYRHPATQPQDAAAYNPENDYYQYTLNVELVNGSCGSSNSNTYPSLNAFSIRTNGELAQVSDRLQFIGRDATAGDLTAYNGVPVRDTHYDGIFAFPIVMGTAIGPFTEINIRDADADDSDDALDPAGLWGSSDVQATGVANGANSEIEYELFGFFDPAGPWFSLGNQPNVSGQYGASPPHDEEEKKFSTQGYPWGAWMWTAVRPQNNVHIRLPEDAQMKGNYYFVSPRLWNMQAGLHWSSAKTVTAWTGDGSVSMHLPVSMGLGLNTIRLMAPSETDAIFTYQYSPCAEPRPSMELLQLMAELLAAKLNVSHAWTVDEDLANAKLYASLDRVGSVISHADERLVLCAPDADERWLMRASAIELRAVNARFVDNRWF